MLGTLIAGAGPGLGTFIAAARSAGLGDWLDQGLEVVEKGDTWEGDLGRYRVNADTAAMTFLECLEGPALGVLLEQFGNMKPQGNKSAKDPANVMIRPANVYKGLHL